MSYHDKIMVSPVGDLTLIASDAGLAGIRWETDAPGHDGLTPRHRAPQHPLLCRVEQQLEEYFDGQRRLFEVPLDFHGTPFQRSVWQALLTIPYGQTRTYAQIAAQLGRPTATRAVGAANGRNPISIITPCHRVIGSNGRLTGFAGGLATKQYLLGLESRQATLALD